MAQLVLSNIGAAIGSELLPQGLSAFGGEISGAAIGRAVGSLAGAAIDARYLTPPIQGPRVKDFHITSSREGASIPVIYGRMRVGAEVIWAATFKERRETEGGKGGPRVTDYSYSLSFAVGLCEGEIARVSRCWANGEAFDLSKVTWRLYRGTEDQSPDPLIEAIEGAGEAPAYRGLAYIVFEDMPVDVFGARLPQLSFEVMRPAGGGEQRLEAMARAVNLIPGSGEFALASDVVRRSNGPGREIAENQHSAEAVSDFEASLDQLEAELPNVREVNLVVCWFGSDLRCGECAIRPGVEIAGKADKPWNWSVAGVSRGSAYVVSQTDGRPSYGGTPADMAVKQAIASLRSRGLSVTLYPMLLMDIPAGNGLLDPWGGAEQAAFPWRGRVTCHPAPGQAGTADGSADAADQVAAFFDAYRDFVLHYATLAGEAGGVDGFLLGSELVGLTRLRDAAGGYPAVEALRALAGDVRDALGSDVDISYGADWTEYGAHVSPGGDVAFPLDALWADDAISHVGLDWYPPMADWRDGDAHADAAFGDPRSIAYLGANTAGGEAFDWYYVDEAGRIAQDRLPITDGAYGEPWVFRQKDIAGWWSAAHYPRSSGVRSVTPTAWAPGMKPVRFVEMGCPAVDKGANQPNVFYDPKSSESALPHYSDGSRDDLIQRRALEAFLAHWADAANNPASTAYDGRMVADDGVALWAWDARPYPAYPARDDVWDDAPNWRLGHWLNGRVAAALLPDVVGDICAKADAEADVSAISGVVSGYGFEGPVSARRALEQLTQAYGVDVVEHDGLLAFRSQTAATIVLDPGLLVEDDAPALDLARGGMEGSEVRVRLSFIDAGNDYAPGIEFSPGGPGADIVDAEAALSFDHGQAQTLARGIAETLTLQRDRAQFALTVQGLAFEAGDVVSLGGDSYRIVGITDEAVMRFDARRIGFARALALTPAEPVAPPQPVWPVEPDIVIVDGPPLPGEEDDLRPLAFAFAQPWSGAVNLSAGADASQFTRRGRIERPCAIGRLTTALFPHVSGRWQETSVWVSVPGNGPASRTEAAVLNGANAMMVETAAGWEMIQFVEAELVDVETYRLTKLLRGQQGSEPAMAAGAEIGARVAFLTGAECRLDVADWERGLELAWRAWRGNLDDPGAWDGEASYAAAGARMWSPAQLRAEWAGGDLAVGWIRRARKGGDAWGPGEPPNEIAEAYRVRVLDGGDVLREWAVTRPSTTYEAASIAADFPAGGVATVEVAQIGADGEPGAAAAVAVAIPA
jgi:hypothetical protein